VRAGLTGLPLIMSHTKDFYTSRCLATADLLSANLRSCEGCGGTLLPKATLPSEPCQVPSITSVRSLGISAQCPVPVLLPSTQCPCRVLSAEYLTPYEHCSAHFRVPRTHCRLQSITIPSAQCPVIRVPCPVSVPIALCSNSQCPCPLPVQ
jgi:hypothetical protein